MNDPTVQNDPVLQVMTRCGEIQVIVNHIQQARHEVMENLEYYRKTAAQAMIEMDKLLKALETLESGSEEIKMKLNQPMIRQGNKIISVFQCLKEELKEISLVIN